MRTTLKNLLLISALILLGHQTASANVQPPPIQLEKYSVAQGLSEETVTDIVVDAFGYVWTGSLQNGLDRFDGYHHVNFRHDAEDPTSLPFNYVRQLFLDKRDNLWVVTHNGLARFDYQKENFKVFNPENSALESELIWTIATSVNDELLVADEGQLYVFDSENDSFAPYDLGAQSPPADVKTLLDTSEALWLGSFDGGLFRLDKLNNQLQLMTLTDNQNTRPEPELILNLKQIGSQIWVGTEVGLYILNPNGQVQHYFNPETETAISGSEVRTIERVSEEKVWLGTNNGITIVDLESLSTEVYDGRYLARQGISDPYIQRIALGENDTVWIGTFISGLLKYHPTFAAITNYSTSTNSSVSDSLNMIWAIDQDSDGNIWLASQNSGIAKLQSSNGELTQSLSEDVNTIWDLEIDSQDRFWISTSDGLWLYVKNGNGIAAKQHLLPGHLITTSRIIESRLWLSSVDGNLYWVDLDTLELGSLTMPYDGIESAYPVFLDSQDKLWLTTNIGTIQLDLRSQRFKQIPLSIEGKNLSLIDGFEVNNKIWLTTLYNGLVVLSADDLTVEKVIGPAETSSFISSVSTVILEGKLWLASNDGIFVVDTESASIQKHLTRKLFDYETFNEDAVHLSDNGLLFLGGVNGVHLIDPSKFEALDEHFSAKPQLTELRIFNTPVDDYTPQGPLAGPLFQQDSISLQNTDSPFSIGFGVVNPVSKSDTEYRYRLTGSDKGWLMADRGQTLATYTNLNHGNYLFEVQARQNKGMWSDSRTLSVIIHPPIWLHRYAIAAYLALFSLVSVYWLRQMRQKKQVLKQIKENEETLKLTLWSSGDELWDWHIPEGQLKRSNTWGTMDFPQDENRANSAYECNIHPSDKNRVTQALEQHLQGDSEHYEETYRVKTFRDEWMWVNDCGKVVERDDNNAPLRMTGTLKNINHFKQAEEQLRLFKRSIETISDGVFIANRQFKFISVNQAYCKYTGQSRDQALATYLQFNQYPEPFTEEVKKTLLQKGNWSGEVESIRSNGDRFEIDLNIDAIQGEDGGISHFVGVFSDITARKTTEKELLKLANTDPLTDLPNRSFFQASHQNLVRKNTSHTLLCMDMDNFKKINDSMGHQVGDVLIKQVAKRLQKLTGSNATCYRLGGDEFAVLVDKTTDVHRITHFAQFILDEMARPFIFNKQEFVLGASIGIAIFPMDGTSSQELLKNADTAMYFAKNAGGNKYQFFSGEMNQNAVRQLQIENLIRHGLKEDLFTVFYQPKIDIKSGQMVSMEALVRFEHPEKGVVSPNQFIPLSEETGQIIEIGEIVMRKACSDTQRWVSQGLFTGRVAINLSARQFELPDLDDRIENILQQTGLSPLHLECEITEGTLMQQPEQSLVLMQRLREKGIHLALDDFGTGYSSLAYLKEFPLNTLKIDKAFIDGIATSNVDRQMISAIITIAHNLGLKVVAEGVEEERQLQILRQYKCEQLQGYLYSKPLSSERFEKLLVENKQLNRFIKDPQG